MEGQRRSRYNDELYEMYGSVVQRISSPGSGGLAMLYVSKHQGQRRRARPKLSWQHGLEASAIKAGITDWQTKARDRASYSPEAGQDRKTVVASDK